MLEPLHFTRLTNLESGQHVKNVYNNLTTTATITDPHLQYYVSAVGDSSNLYDESLLQLAKSDETEKIVKADLQRDRAISTLVRAVNVFEFSDDENEKLAYKSMKNLLGNYANLQSWNFLEETNGIDNLIADFAKPKYVAHVQLLKLGTYINKVQSANAVFRSFFQGRTIEEVEKPVQDTKKLRRSMQNIYDDMTDYVFAMTKVPNPKPEFLKALKILNIERKYSSDLLARRSGGDEPDAPAS